MQQPSQDFTRSNTSIIGDVEVLRAIAVTMVIFGHLPFLFFWWPQWLSTLYGHVALWGGVDLFFTISGFVITRDLVLRMEQASSDGNAWVTAGGFWIRRAYRILPTAWLWLVIVLALSAIFNNTGVFTTFKRNLGDAVSVIMQIANLHAYECVAAPSNCGVNGVYWSLSTEEQFYLAIPLLMIFLRRHLPLFLIAVVVAQALYPRPPWTFWWTFRTDALCLGVLLAIWSHHPTYKMFEPAFLARRHLRIPLILLLLVLLVIIPGYEPTKKFPVAAISTGLLGVACFVFVFVASYDRNYVLGRGFLKRALLWIGSRSFGLYIIHIPAFGFVRELWSRLHPGVQFDSAYTAVFLATALPLTIALVELNYRLVELPLRNRGRRIDKEWQARARSIVAPSAVAAGSVNVRDRFPPATQ